MKNPAVKIFRATKKIPRRIFLLFGGEPERYWGGLLVCFAAATIGVVFWGIYLFISTNRIISEGVVLPEGRRLLDIDEEGLNRAFDILTEREAEYADILNSPAPADPSL